MSKRKSSIGDPPANVLPAEIGELSSPSKSVQRFVSMALIAHFSVLLTALSANIAPSYLQGQLVEWCSPYLITTNQDYGAIPIGLTHAEEIDFPLVIELLPSDEASHDDSAWHVLKIPDTEMSSSGTANFRASRWPNYARLIRLITVDQPDSEILSDIATSLVTFAEQQSRVNYRAIRMRAAKVLSYDEDAALTSNQGELIAAELSNSTCYGANILRTSDKRIVLVPFQESLRTAKPKRMPASVEGSNK